MLNENKDISPVSRCKQLYSESLKHTIQWVMGCEKEHLQVAESIQICNPDFPKSN